MALHTQLPIYRDAYQLLQVLVRVTRHIPRDFKRLIGEKVRDEAVEILVLVFRTNVHRDKARYLTDLIERVQVVELIMRMSKDMKLISIGQHAQIISLTQSIGKQATGWKKSVASAA